MSRRQPPSENLIANLKMLKEATDIKMDKLAEKSGISKRNIYYILDGERTPSVDAAEQLGRVFGLTGWEMIMPNLKLEMIKNGKLEKLVENYSNSSDEGRDMIDRVAEREAAYQATHS